jgi:hypothetical protein
MLETWCGAGDLLPEIMTSWRPDAGCDAVTRYEILWHRLALNMLQFLLSIVISAAASIMFSLSRLHRKSAKLFWQTCRYKGGQWSAHRTRREMRSYLRYYSDLIVPCVLTVPAMFVALQYLTDQIPINTAIRSIQTFDPDQQTWRDNLQEVRMEHAQSLRKNRGLSEDHIASIQHDLWYRWPLIV